MGDDPKQDRHAEMLRALTDDAWLRRIAQSLVRDDSAGDLVGDTAASALGAADRLDGPPGPWLVTILKNHARQAWRSLENRSRRERESLPPASSKSPAEIAEIRDLQRVVARELLALDDPFRSTLLRRFFEDRSHAEIAEIDGVSPGTVRWRQHRGLELLRERLDARHGGDRGKWKTAVIPLAARMAPSPAGLVVEIVTGHSVAIAIGAVLLAIVALFATIGRHDATTDPSAQGREERAVTLAPLPPSPHSNLERTEAQSTPPTETAVPVDRGRVRAHFRDDSGLPLSGVKVTVSQNHNPDPIATDPVGRSDSNGVAEIDVAPRLTGGVQVRPAFEATLRFEAEGWLGAWMQILLHSGETTDLGEIRLARGGRIRGRVVDPNARPVCGAAVSIDSEFVEHDYEHLGAQVVMPDVVTDERGEFVATDLPAGLASLHARAPPALPSARVHVDVEVDADAILPDLVLGTHTTGSILHGIVTGPNGEPIDNVAVDIVGVEVDEALWPITFFAATDRLGTFAVDTGGRATDSFSIHVTDSLQRFGPAIVERVAPGPTPVEIRLAPPEWLSIHAISTTGRPVEQLFGQLETRTHDQLHSSQVLRMGASERHLDGRVTVPKPRTRFWVNLRASGYLDLFSGPFDPQAVGNELRLTFTPATPIEGRVLKNGLPVAGAIVSVARGRDWTLPYASTVWIARAFPSRYVHPFPTMPVSTDRDGRFSIAPSVPDEYVLRAAMPGSGSKTSLPFLYGSEEAQAEIVLELPRPCSLDGQLVAPPGESIAARIVGASLGDGFVRTTRTGPDGRFQIDDLEPGSWTVALCSREIDLDLGFPPTSLPPMDGRIPANAQVVTLEEGGSAHVVLDLTQRDVVRVSGRIRIHGEGTHSVHSYFEAPSERTRNHWEPLGRAARLSRSGEYSVLLPQSGNYRITLRPIGTDLRIETECAFAAGENLFDVEIETGTLELAATDEVSYFDAEQYDEARGLRATTRIVTRRDGLPVSTLLLAGRATLVPLRFHADEGFLRDDTRESTEIVIPAGGLVFHRPVR